MLVDGGEEGFGFVGFLEVTGRTEFQRALAETGLLAGGEKAAPVTSVKVVPPFVERSSMRRLPAIEPTA